MCLTVKVVTLRCLALVHTGPILRWGLECDTVQRLLTSPAAHLFFHNPEENQFMGKMPEDDDGREVYSRIHGSS